MDFGVKMGYYLLVKTAIPTGLKYLCKCRDNKDPYKYSGSGVFWRKHLEKHKCTWDTIILGHFEDNDSLKQAGLKYSQLWNIVESTEWANYIPEIGDGGPTISNRVFAYDPVTLKTCIFAKSEIPSGWIKGRPPKGPRDPEVTAKIVSAQKGQKRSDEAKLNMKNASRIPRYRIQCSVCDRHITSQNLKRHMEITHGERKKI
jgi:hypothetical protein